MKFDDDEFWEATGVGVAVVLTAASIADFILVGALFVRFLL